MNIHSAEFLVGAASPGQFPPPYLPEVAFAGKSNVGKSSLINTLLNRKQLVKTSSTPGKTREINFFLINGKFRLVDLPGYGFSRASKAKQSGWEALIETYLRERPCLKGLVLILDTRHEPGSLDRAMKEWLDACGVRYLTVASKTDKLKKAQLSRQVALLREGLALDEPPLPFSAKTRAGRGGLWQRLEGWLAEPLAAGGGG
jgi:GTP-binding protein